MPLSMIFAYQEWPYRQVFTISRDSRAAAGLFVVHVQDGNHIGRGECGLQSLHGETQDTLVAELETIAERLPALGSRAALNAEIPASSARNAVDCALWDLACKQAAQSIWQLTGLVPPPSLEVDLTIGIGSLEQMRADAMRAAAAGYSLLKIKADARAVEEKLSAIRDAVPSARFIVDANEAWNFDQLVELAPRLKTLGVVLIEQPLHHDSDAALSDFDSPIPLCADESCATRTGLDRLATCYDAINIKLDKCGGLTEGLALARQARALGLGLMVGCNGATSLGNAPAYVLGSLADWRDIDSQELLFEDRAHGMRTAGGRLYKFSENLWG